MKNKLIYLIMIVTVAGISGYLAYSNFGENYNENNQAKKTTIQTANNQNDSLDQDSIQQDSLPKTENVGGEESDNSGKDSSSYTDISPAEAKELIESNPDVIIIDVSNIYDQGHIPGAVNYYVGDGSLDEAIASLDPEDTYLVYCHVDSAAIAGAEKLVEAGFENVYRLEGNYSAWVDAGYETEK